MIDQPKSPVKPRPSASIVLVRDGETAPVESLEVLMVKRNDAAHFMPGVWVFPGGAVDPGDGDPAAGFDTFGACARRELAEEAGVTLAPETELVPFNRWITPEFLPVRFDARFFLAPAPVGAEPVVDGREAVAGGWFKPGAALAASKRDEMNIAFPTIHQLDELSRFATVAAALAAYRDRQTEPILPVPIESADGMRLTLPGDPDYPG